MADFHEVVREGFETARVSPALEEQRHPVRVRARGNLAALVVERHGGLEAVAVDGTAAAAEFADLCGALGLDDLGPTTPGVCRGDGCVRVLPWHSLRYSVTTRRPWLAKGFCSERCLERTEGGG